MNREDRNIRRAAGVLAVGLGEAQLGKVEDARSEKGRKWRSVVLLRAVMLGLLTGMRSFKETERLTGRIAHPFRRQLGINRRVPDTTMRELVLSSPLTSFFAALHAQVLRALRKKQLEPFGVPCGLLSFDGKTTVTSMDDGEFAQEQGGHFVVRTMTCALVSGPGTVTVHASPVPRGTNEMGHFIPTLREVMAAYGHTDMFRMVLADAGMTSLANASYVDGLGLGYVFALKAGQHELYGEADRFLARCEASEAAAKTTEHVRGETHVRRLWLTEEAAGANDWTHLKTILRVQYQIQAKDGSVRQSWDRYFVTNRPAGRFTPTEWLAIVRAHWRIENGVHQTLDVAMNEDDHPWMYDPRGMLRLMVLRRIACNALMLFRTVSFRGERKDLRNGQKNLLPWRELFEWLSWAVLVARDEHTAGLRWEPRTIALP